MVHVLDKATADASVCPVTHDIWILSGPYNSVWVYQRSDIKTPV